MKTSRSIALAPLLLILATLSAADEKADSTTASSSHVEYLADGQAKVRINTLSGTYALPMVKEGIWTSDDLRHRSGQWFNEVLRRRFAWPASLTVEEAVEGGKDA